MSKKPKSKPRKKTVTVTMKLNKDGTVTYRSTGGFDLRKLFPSKIKEETL